MPTPQFQDVTPAPNQPRQVKVHVGGMAGYCVFAAVTWDDQGNQIKGGAYSNFREAVGALVVDHPELFNVQID